MLLQKSGRVMKIRAWLTCVIVLLAAPFARSADAPPGIDWQEWSPSVFERAKAEKKFVLLDLHAVWCHWCHVMDEQTYANPKVAALIRAKYIAVGVDQDSRPDLANRYENYGWPATVIFSADGSEIVKRRGFIPPGEMSALLQAVIDDPTPGPSVEPEEKITYGTAPALSEPLRKELRAALLDGYDKKNGGWGTGHKFLDWDNVEYCIARAQAGDAQCEKMARQTLAAQLNLLDPVWGGVYQYSTDGDWQHPHFEKLLLFQAENLRTYALAHSFWKEADYIEAAAAIHRYVRDFLTGKDGAVYTSQDADIVQGEHAGEYFKLNDAARRKLGVPRVDTHNYSRENGRMISALVQMYAATGEEKFLGEATRAANFIIENRALGSGGFRHDLANDAGPYLADSLTMGRAFLDLYAATGNADWLYRSEDCARYIADRFVLDDTSQPGALTVAVSSANISDPRPQFDENTLLARYANLLHRYTDNALYRQLAESAMRYLATPEIARSRRAYTGALLLADSEMNTAPLHIVIVGKKDDPTAIALFRVAVRQPAVYKQVEWSVPGGEVLHKEDNYPALPVAVAYLCTATSCSSPIYKPDEIAPRIERLSKARK